MHQLKTLLVSSEHTEPSNQFTQCRILIKEQVFDCIAVYVTFFAQFPVNRVCGSSFERKLLQGVPFGVIAECCEKSLV